MQAKERKNERMNEPPPKSCQHIPCSGTTPLEQEAEMQNRLQHFISIIMSFAPLTDMIKTFVLLLQCQEESSLYFSLPLCYRTDF